MAGTTEVKTNEPPSQLGAEALLAHARLVPQMPGASTVRAWCWRPLAIWDGGGLG